MARPLSRIGGQKLGWRWLAEEGAEQLADRVLRSIPPIEFPGVRKLASFFLEGRPPAFLNGEGSLETAAEICHCPVYFNPESAVAGYGRNAEVQANLGDRATDGTTADLGFEFLQRRHVKMRGMVGIDVRPARRLLTRRGGRTEFYLQRLDIRRVRALGGFGRLDIAALRGAGEQKTLQHHGAEDAALHMIENAAHIVRAEAGRQSGKAWVLGTIGEGSVQVLGIAEEDPDNTEDRGDARRHGFSDPALGRGWGFGACGMRRRSVHDCRTNIISYFCQGLLACIADRIALTIIIVVTEMTPPCNASALPP